MADSFSSKLRVRLQATGGNRNTWGGQLNAAALQLLEDAICGYAQATIAGTDITLSVSNGANDQARMAIVELIGAPGASRNVIVPATSKLYVVINNTGAAQTVKTSGGTGISVPAGARQHLMCDGTNVVAVQTNSLGTVADSDALGGFPASAYARKNAFNQFTMGSATSFVDLVDGGTVTVDATQSNNFFLLIGGNRTLQFSNQADGQAFEIWIKQDATGGRDITWPAEVVFEAGQDGSLSQDAGAIDRFKLTYNADLNTFLASRALGGNASSITLNLTASAINLNAYLLAGSPAGAVTFTLNIAEGVVVQSISPDSPAIDFTGFANGSTINLINEGYILGCGGYGGDGGEMAVSGGGDNDDLYYYAWNKAKFAGDGGDAIKGPGSGRTFNITNADGFIWGGGGGGGGGGTSVTRGPEVGNGGGGGGGAGGGRGGRGGSANTKDLDVTVADNGEEGGIGSGGTFGAGGTGTGSGGTGGDGGDGGDWGAAGDAGDSPTGGADDFAGGTGGAAGLAVDQNGGTANFVSGSGSPHVKGSVT